MGFLEAILVRKKVRGQFSHFWIYVVSRERFTTKNTGKAGATKNSDSESKPIAFEQRGGIAMHRACLEREKRPLTQLALSPRATNEA